MGLPRVVELTGEHTGGVKTGEHSSKQQFHHGMARTVSLGDL